MKIYTIGGLDLGCIQADFASNYSSCSIFLDLQDMCTLTPLQAK